MSYEFLRQIIEQSRGGRITTKHYINLFDCISTELIKQREMDNLQQYREFIRGLLSQVRDRIFRDFNYEPNNPRTHNYSKIY